MVATKGIVVLGPDESGQSSLVKAIQAQFLREVSVRFLGMSDGA